MRPLDGKPTKRGLRRAGRGIPAGRRATHPARATPLRVRHEPPGWPARMTGGRYTGMELAWESAQNAESPQDARAATALLPHGFWYTGPNPGGVWGLTLVEQDAGGVIFAWEWTGPSEYAVRRIAQATEDLGLLPGKGD